jgi:hypothetical protein
MLGTNPDTEMTFQRLLDRELANPDLRWAPVGAQTRTPSRSTPPCSSNGATVS